MNTKYAYAGIIANIYLASFLTLGALTLPNTAVADYATWCEECHLPLAISTRKKSSAAQIAHAISSIPTMQIYKIVKDPEVMPPEYLYLKDITAQEIDSIAVELGSRSTCRKPFIWAGGGTICARQTRTCPDSKMQLNGYCVKPLPVCTEPQLLQNGICSTPPTCDQDQELVGGACTDAVSARTCHNYIDELGDTGLPARSTVILTAPIRMPTIVGLEIKIEVTAFDCIGQAVTIKASKLPKGAKVVYSFDPVLGMQKAVVTWTPTAKYAAKVVNLVFKASTKNRDSKVTKSTEVQVLPPV